MTALRDLNFNNRNLDSFGRLRVSNPVGLFDSQLTYNLQPLLFEKVEAESGAAVTHDAINRNALMTFSATPTGGKAFMQSFEHFRYQPQRSQLIAISFNFLEASTDTLKFAGYSDGTNGIEFRNNGTVNQVAILSTTGNGNQIIDQDNWNLDKLDGTGSSGITLDISKSQILIMDFQALYTGVVRIGFDIGGVIRYIHKFEHANEIVDPWIATANLPIRCGMTCTGTVSTTMKFTCSAVSSEGGQEQNTFDFAQEGIATAADGARTHLLSLRPKLTFNNITNRTSIKFPEITIAVTGTKPILWELVLGQGITGADSFNDVNTTYSSTEYNTTGTINGSPALVIGSGYTVATNQSKGVTNADIVSKYPITLDVSGSVRSLGTLSLLVTGLGGSSTCRGSIKFSELR